MTKVSFQHASERWFRLMNAEATAMAAKKGDALLSWEALDHLCGLAVEAGMKALLIHGKLVNADANGDYPCGPDGRRPHVDQLWDDFVTKAQGRKVSDWVSALRQKGGASGSAPANPFVSWRADHRYAVDGTVAEALVQARLDMAKRLQRIAQDEGVL